MANNVTLPGTGVPVESIDIGAGVERQVVTVGDRAGGTVDSIGGLTETAPATDTASSGLNGRLQRIAQRLTSLIGSTLAVSNAGTFAVQNSSATPTGANIIGKVGVDQTTDGTTNKVAADLRVAGSAVAVGAGVSGSTVPRMTLASDSPGVTTLGQNTRSNSLPVTIADINSGEYETVAASQTAQVLGATGGTGDYISGLLVIPATTSPGNVLLLDNATSITVFTGGATSVSNLVPFFIPLGMYSVSGAWKVTTGASVSVIGIGNFT